MNILIVEDDLSKSDDLVAFSIREFPQCTYEVARSFQSGLRAVLEGSHDLVLLDMTMSNYDRSIEDDGGRPHHFAGREILRQMLREEVVTPAIVVTHFGRFGEEAEEVTLAELKADLEVRFPNYIGTVHYRSNVNDWESQLLEMISEAERRKNV